MAELWPSKEHGVDFSPSEYFRRQIYGMFWFEESTLPLFGRFADNVMFETDFPHTTSLSPGPGSEFPLPLVCDREGQEGIGCGDL